MNSPLCLWAWTECPFSLPGAAYKIKRASPSIGIHAFSTSDKRITARCGCFQSLTFLLSSILPMASGFWYYHSTERLHFLGSTWKTTLAHTGTKTPPASRSPRDGTGFNQLGMILFCFQYRQAVVQHTWSSSWKVLKEKFKDKVTGKIPFPAPRPTLSALNFMAVLTCQEFSFWC